MVIEFHKKYVKRLADIFKKKSKEEGSQAAEEWASRTLTPDLIPEVSRVIQGKK